MTVAFLILHYNEIELTKRAVDSIIAMDGDRYIVIVDNCSPNGSGNELCRLYDEKIIDANAHEVPIKVILNSENSGFSAGNNIGYRYIREHLDADCVVALNNDISFPQNDFIDILERLYANSSPKFYLAGPDVYTPHIRSHISPIATGVRSKADIEKMIEVNDARINNAKSHSSASDYFRYIQEKYQNSSVLKLYNAVRSASTYSAASPYDKVTYNCVLNGACLIFMRDYIEKYDVLFEELTFLYGEEDFLTYRLANNDELIRYCPELITYHVGEGSAGYTKMNYNEYKAKIAKTSAKVNEALRVYIDYISTDSNS